MFQGQMTTGQYLAELLKSQRLTENQRFNLSNLYDNISSIVETELGDTAIHRIGGSQKKGTEISSAYDLDIQVLCPRKHPWNVEEIFEGVGNVLNRYGKWPQRRKVAWEIPFEGNFHIDVVPGKYYQANLTQVTLWDSGREEGKNINLMKHYKRLKGSGLHDYIRLLKLWKHRKGVPLPTYLLENMLLRAFDGTRPGGLENGLYTALEYIYKQIPSISMVDPENKAYVISGSLSGDDRQTIRGLAGQALDDMDKERIRVVFE